MAAFLAQVCVRQRLYVRSATSMVQYTLLLVLFGTAAVKSVHVPMLCLTLLAEVNTVVRPFVHVV